MDQSVEKLTYQSLGSSAVERHYACSLLPKQFEAYETSHFKKSRQFYKPEECIWNNAHRTCQKVYRYYHQGAEIYKKSREPSLRQQQLEDRSQQQMKRVLKLTMHRHKSRNQFLLNKLGRIELQERTGLQKLMQKAKAETEASLILNQSASFYNSKQMEKSELNLEKINLSKSKSFASTGGSSKASIYRRSNSKSKENKEMSKSHLSFVKGVEQSDAKRLRMLKNVELRQFQMRERIREDFTKKKLLNVESWNRKGWAGESRSTFNVCEDANSTKKLR